MDILKTFVVIIHITKLVFCCCFFFDFFWGGERGGGALFSLILILDKTYELAGDNLSFFSSDTAMFGELNLQLIY